MSAKLKKIDQKKKFPLFGFIFAAITATLLIVFVFFLPKSTIVVNKNSNSEVVSKNSNSEQSVENLKESR